MYVPLTLLRNIPCSASPSFGCEIDVSPWGSNFARREWYTAVLSTYDESTEEVCKYEVWSECGVWWEIMGIILVSNESQKWQTTVPSPCAFRTLPWGPTYPSMGAVWKGQWENMSLVCPTYTYEKQRGSTDTRFRRVLHRNAKAVIKRNWPGQEEYCLSGRGLSVLREWPWWQSRV